MDIQKHGGRIFLPQHLHGELKDYQLLLLGGCKRKRSAPSEAMSIRRSKEENTTKFNVSSANVSKSRSNDKDDRSLVDLKKARLSLKGATTHDDVDSCYMCNDGGGT
jgi:hypothetical protein